MEQSMKGYALILEQLCCDFLNTARYSSAAATNLFRYLQMRATDGSEISEQQCQRMYIAHRLLQAEIRWRDCLQRHEVFQSKIAKLKVMLSQLSSYKFTGNIPLYDIEQLRDGRMLSSISLYDVRPATGRKYRPWLRLSFWFFRWRERDKIILLQQQIDRLGPQEEELCCQFKTVISDMSHWLSAAGLVSDQHSSLQAPACICNLIDCYDWALEQHELAGNLFYYRSDRMQQLVESAIAFARYVPTP